MTRKKLQNVLWMIEPRQIIHQQVLLMDIAYFPRIIFHGLKSNFDRTDRAILFLRTCSYWFKSQNS